MGKVVKRVVVLMMVFSILMGSLPSFGSFYVKAADSDVIRNDETGIPDKALYQIILKELGKTPDSTFTEEEAQNVRGLEQGVFSVDDSDRKEENQVVSLQGIEKLAHLRALKLGRNKVTDFKPLEKLKDLVFLGLEYSYCITSIEGLRNLTELEYLRLPATVTDLSPIEGMTHLKGLTAAHSGISILPDLTGHMDLTGFDTRLQGNNLTKKELTTKLPEQLVEDKAWMKMTIDLQEYNMRKMSKTLKVTSPKKVTKISSKTKTIIGKASKNVCVDLYYSNGEPDARRFIIKRSKVDKNGVFKLKNLKLKKYKNKKLFLVSSYINTYYVDRPYVMKTISFRMKK